MGIFHIHAYLPFLPQKPIWGQDHHPEISQFPEFSDYWFHHLTRTDKIQLTKLSSFQHVQMECHLNGTFDQKERIIPLGFHISPISSGFCRPSLGHQRTSGQAEVYTWDPWRGSPGKNGCLEIPMSFLNRSWWRNPDLLKSKSFCWFSRSWRDTIQKSILLGRLFEDCLFRCHTTSDFFQILKIKWNCRVFHHPALGVAWNLSRNCPDGIFTGLQVANTRGVDMLGPTKSRLQIFVQHVLHQKESSTGISCQTDVKLLRHAVFFCRTNYIVRQ